MGADGTLSRSWRRVTRFPTQRACSRAARPGTRRPCWTRRLGAGAGVGRRFGKLDGASAQALIWPKSRRLPAHLLRSGASIGDINAVRKHLSRIKGGRLARRAFPAELVTLAISDVPGDDPAVIGSGPTVPDPSTLADARAHHSPLPACTDPGDRGRASDPSNETPKPGDATFRANNFRLIARPADAFRAAEQAASAAGYEWLFLGDNLEGEAREVAAQHAQLALRQDPGKRGCIILSGGELTVTLRGKGHGGPNQEYALALAITLAGHLGSRPSPPTPTGPMAAAVTRMTRPVPISTRPLDTGPRPWARSSGLSVRQ